MGKEKEEEKEEEEEEEEGRDVSSITVVVLEEEKEIPALKKHTKTDPSVLKVALQAKSHHQKQTNRVFSLIFYCHFLRNTKYRP